MTMALGGQILLGSGLTVYRIRTVLPTSKA